MAKRAPVGEEPYRPLLDPSLVAAAISPKKPDSEAIKEPILRREPLVGRHNSQPVGDVRRIQNIEGRTFQAPRPLIEKMDCEKRVLLTRSENAAVERLVNALAGRLNTQLKLSHVLRALTVLLLNAEDELERKARDVNLTRPANGDFNGIQRFEREIAKLMESAIRDSRPIRDI